MSTQSRTEVRTHLLGDAVRRHKALILLVTLLVTAAVAALALTRPTSYTASTTLLLRPTLGNPFSTDSGTSGPEVTTAMTTEASVVDSAAVAALSNKKLKPHWTPGTGTVVATVLPNTQILQVSYLAGTAAQAQKGAQTVASTYLTYRSSRTSTTQKARLAILDKQISAVKSSLASASKAASATSAPPQATQQVQLYSNQLVTLQTTVGTLQATGADPGTIVSPAALPTSASSLNPWLLIAAGAVLGLLAGLTLAIWREREDDRVRGASDAFVGGVPVLGTIAAGSGRRGKGAGRPAAIARVRTATIASAPSPAVVAVADIADTVDRAKDAPATSVAVELASSLRRSGYRVTLVSAAGDGRLEQQLGIEPAQGLSEALTGAAAGPLLRSQGDLQVLTSGSNPGDCAELLAGSRLLQVLEQLQQGADYVVVLAPGASTPAGMALARATSALVLVGEDKRTSHQDVADVVTRAEQLGVRVLGAVLAPRGGRRARGASEPGRRGTSGSSADTRSALPFASGAAGGTSGGSGTSGATALGSSGAAAPVLQPSSTGGAGSASGQ